MGFQERKGVGCWDVASRRNSMGKGLGVQNTEVLAYLKSLVQMKCWGVIVSSWGHALSRFLGCAQPWLTTDSVLLVCCLVSRCVFFLCSNLSLRFWPAAPLTGLSFSLHHTCVFPLSLHPLWPGISAKEPMEGQLWLLCVFFVCFLIVFNHSLLIWQMSLGFSQLS